MLLKRDSKYVYSNMKFKSIYKIGLFVIFFCGQWSLSAKEIQPALLVYGSGIEAFTAAIQSARSNVPTLWVMETHSLVEELTLRPLKIKDNAGLDGGIWMDLLMGVALNKGVNDSLAQLVKTDINPTLMLNAMEKIIGRESQLTIIRNQHVESLIRDKKTWTVILENKKKYEVRAIVDASSHADLQGKVVKSSVILADVHLKRTETLTLEQIRTTVALAEYQDTSYTLLVKDLLSQNFQELFFIKSLVPESKDAESIPFRAHVGQAVGALAAYCAFFKTTGDKVNVRKLQTELMTYGARLLPWKDVSIRDPNYMAIQKCYLATVLEGKDGNRTFDREDSIKVASIQPIFNKLYSRAQLWFLDNKMEYFSLKDLLSFVQFLSFRGNEVESQVQKDWTKKLKFQGEYNLEHMVNRYEFATLVNKYTDPYTKAVTIDGDIIR